MKEMNSMNEMVEKKETRLITDMILYDANELTGKHLRHRVKMITLNISEFEIQETQAETEFVDSIS